MNHSSPPPRDSRDFEKLTAQLDALLRSSSEVRYRINADWSELAQLQGGGFIPDNPVPNPNWLEEYIPQDHRDLVRAEIARAIAAKDTYDIEHKVNRVDGTVGWALSRAVPLFDEHGEIESWMGAASDITARKTSEEALRLLNLELAHRMKNTLAMVQSIVSQTLRTASSTEEAQLAIAARLDALARAQDILLQTKFSEADIRDIVDEAVRPHRSEPERLSIAGPSHRLTPQQAFGLSLAIHELATNAVKYGALSNESGRVVMSWKREADAFVFDWIESGGPEVSAPASRGFGSRLIEKVVGAYFRGTGEIAFRPEGLHFRLTGSLDKAS
ncbi:HWE histidine kinase domain-containing protein [Bosea sp. TWI1241]|uniref:sensor histidine kinase n=1 Tax=Bosea sp. TWI1241 TaxID=3148904 RepID=UPI00320824C4